MSCTPSPRASRLLSCAGRRRYDALVPNQLADAGWDVDWALRETHPEPRVPAEALRPIALCGRRCGLRREPSAGGAEVGAGGSALSLWMGGPSRGSAARFTAWGSLADRTPSPRSVGLGVSLVRALRLPCLLLLGSSLLRLEALQQPLTVSLCLGLTSVALTACLDGCVDLACGPGHGL